MIVSKGVIRYNSYWLFDWDYDKIEVIVHPQWVIHSMIKYEDGAILAQHINQIYLIATIQQSCSK